MPLRICVVCWHTSLEAVLGDSQIAKLWAAQPDALLELRLDAYCDLTPERLVQALTRLGPRRCVLTFRVPQQGGLARTDSADNVRAACLQSALRLGVFAVDLEIESLHRHAVLRALWKQGPALRVASHHSLDSVPSLAELLSHRQAAEALGADIVKIVVAPRDLLDAQPLLQLLQTPSSNKVPLIGLGTGEAGLWSRLLCGRWANPAPWTYTCWPQSEPIAPGQVSWTEAIDLYRIQQVTPRTPVFGVTGAPIGHSLSPVLHNNWFAQARRDGIYLPLQLDSKLDEFLTNMAAPLGIVGLSVTHPLKQAACAAALTCTDRARAIGAVNTLWRVRRDQADAWHGDNTDIAAAVDSLERLADGPLTQRVVLVLGAGGVAHAVAFGAHLAGARVYVWARRPEKASALAQTIGCQSLATNRIAALANQASLVVNCTTAGMAPSLNCLPIPIEGFCRSACFFDTIYAPLQTAWLAAAAANGHVTCNGMAMLRHQARAQFERFLACCTP